MDSKKRVRIHISCKDLQDLDTFSKSDPYAVLYSVQGSGLAGGGNQKTGYGKEIGRTEIINNNLNPVFTKAIEMQFMFEVKQELQLVIYDDDGKKNDSENDVCGLVTFQLSHVICSPNGKRQFPLQLPGGTDGRKVVSGTKGTVEISFSDVASQSSRNTIAIGLRGANLVNMASFGSQSTYYVMSRLQPNGSKQVLYKSEVAASTTEPRWALMPQLSLSQFSGATEAAQCLEIELFFPGTFSEKSMGTFKVSLAELKAAHASKSAFSPRKVKDPSKHYGDVFVDTIVLKEAPSFTQSLASGWQINMALSIDFTGSNGDPRSPQSLHLMSPGAPNQYVQAMMSVGDILMEYDTDKQIPVFGFGASVNRVTTHFFNVNMQSDPYVSGIQGALNVYGAFLPTCILSGPTNFAPTILSVTAGARQSEAQRVYTVLLIITDGEITDMRETIDALVMADDAPLSIVIVGVGMGCDFAAMNDLDGDGQNLRASNGRISRRDLVQFVPYRDFLPPKPREALAAEVLREIPDQFEEYLMLAKDRFNAQQRAQASTQFAPVSKA